MSKVTASVVLYNTAQAQLMRLLSCIENSSVRPEVYLIDNSPSRTCLPACRLPSLTYVHSETNGGYGAGHNVALRQTVHTSEFHFVLNPDVYFGPEELEKMVVFMQQKPDVGQLMPKIVYPDGSLQYLCKLLPTPTDLFFRRFMTGPFESLTRKRIERYELRFTGYDQEMNIPYLSGCFMLFRTSALRKVGLFDERFFMYPEDIDITRRINADFRTLFFPGATVVHDHARESYKTRRALWIHIENMIRYFNKWGWIWDAQRSRANKETLRQLRHLYGHRHEITPNRTFSSC